MAPTCAFPERSALGCRVGKSEKQVSACRRRSWHRSCRLSRADGGMPTSCPVVSSISSRSRAPFIVRKSFPSSHAFPLQRTTWPRCVDIGWPMTFRQKAELGFSSRPKRNKEHWLNVRETRRCSCRHLGRRNSFPTRLERKMPNGSSGPQSFPPQSMRFSHDREVVCSLPKWTIWE